MVQGKSSAAGAEQVYKGYLLFATDPCIIEEKQVCGDWLSDILSKQKSTWQLIQCAFYFQAIRY
jgi:hypothetical protein